MLHVYSHKNVMLALRNCKLQYLETSQEDDLAANALF